MPNNVTDYAQMVRQLSGLVDNVAMNPFTKRGMGYPSPTEGAVAPVGGGGRTIRGYHGTDAKFDKFELHRADPREKGVFFSPREDVAKSYGRNVVPVDINLKNAAVVDVSKFYGRPRDFNTNVNPEGAPYQNIISRSIEAARRKKKDFVIIRNVDDTGGVQDQIVALSPKGLVKNAKTGQTMFGMAAGLLGLGEIDDKSR
jgi:hypothetical protein